MSRYFQTACRVVLAALMAVLLVVVLMTISVAAAAQQNPRRLVLKDGSYQAVTQWEVVKDRVRYYSAERFAWEELPKDLIDWPATEKFNKDRAEQRSAAAADVAKEEEKLHQIEEAESPMVVPGLRLPDGGGVFLLDRYRDQPSLVGLVQSGGELNKQMGRNILRAALNPLALSSKQTIELPGLHAHYQSHIGQPEIYISIDNTDESAMPTVDEGKSRNPKPQLPFDRFRIVRMDRRKEARVVGNQNVAVYGKVTQKANWIAANNTKVGEWVRVVPSAPLPPGEYAVVEMLSAKSMNLYVWDFGVDPTAPANSGTWTPRQPAGKEGDSDPALQKRPKT